MRKKMKEVAMRWREVAAPNAYLEFDHEHKGHNKSFKARIQADDAGHPSIAILILQGYKEDYVRRKINRYFNELNASWRRGVKSGDVIHTAFMVNNPPRPGTKVTLPASTNYYAVNNGEISCNGDELGKTYQANFVGRVMDRCKPEVDSVFYTKFKLL